jgi:AhpD family alkylhydroperoxidase
MQARIKNMHTILGDAWGPMVTLGKTLASSPVPEKTRELVHIRTAQINGCAVCLDGHVAKSKETPQRLGAVAVWQEAPFFSEPERAALGLAEAITRLADQTERVPDAVWNEAERYYDEPALAWLVFEVAVANLYNRLNVATRQVAGTQRW